MAIPKNPVRQARKEARQKVRDAKNTVRRETSEFIDQRKKEEQAAKIDYIKKRGEKRADNILSGRKSVFTKVGPIPRINVKNTPTTPSMQGIDAKKIKDYKSGPSSSKPMSVTSPTMKRGGITKKKK